jgi:hypothetical protein
MDAIGEGCLCNTAAVEYYQHLACIKQPSLNASNKRKIKFSGIGFQLLGMVWTNNSEK